jgi:protein-tyrosine kinase
MTDKPDGRGDGKADRASLVERAAKKIVAESNAAPPHSGAIRPIGPTLSTMLDSGESISPPPQPMEGDAVTQVSIAATSNLGPGLESAIPVRRSKSVTIDTARLVSRNLLGPQSKRTRMVEEFRLVKRRLLGRRWAAGERPGNTIIVTSALPEEGKTTIAVNLAMSIAAEEDLRVLLVDADFIKPNALRQLGVTTDKGLIDVIQDPRLDISDVMLTTNIDKLSLIPSGQLHDRCTELLASARMRDIVAELASRYDDRILIFDSPPVLATTESVTLASHMGQIVFVVQAERTRRQLVASALDLIGHKERVSMVLNRATPRLGSTEFGSYYGAYRYAAEKQEVSTPQ